MFLKRVVRKNWTTKTKYYSYSLVESLKWPTDKYYKHKYIISVWSLECFSDHEIKELEQLLVQEITWTKQNTILLNSSKVNEKYEEIIKKYYDKKKLDIVDIDEKERIEELRKTWQYIELNPLEIKQLDVKTIWNENICNSIYNELWMDSIFLGCNFTKRQVEVLRMLILWKVVSPTSKLWTINWAQNRSWIWELTEINYENLSKKLMYSTLNKLEKKQEEVEKMLENKERKMFPDDSIILYDLTNVYLEWKWKKNEYAMYWRSKEKRTDCLLMWLWLVINQNWFVKSSKVFKWNQSEPITFKWMIESMEKNQKNDWENDQKRSGNQKQLKIKERTIIMDAWIATEENISYLKENNYNYVVVKRWAKVNWEQKWDYTLAKQFTNSKWEVLNEIEIRKNETKEELFLECKSKKKNDKEDSIMEKLEKLMEDRLAILSESIKKWTIKTETAINKKLWIIEWKYSRVSKYYDIELKKEILDNNTNLKKEEYVLKWKINEEKKEKYKTKREKYILRTNLKDLNNTEIWDIYNMIRKVEDSFRTLKTDLRIRPIFHQTTENSIAHIFITVLAYHIVNIVLYRLKKWWINIRWSTFLKDMSTQIISTIEQKTITKKIVKTRLISNPTEKQQTYYDILKINPFPHKTKLLTML